MDCKHFTENLAEAGTDEVAEVVWLVLYMLRQ